MSNYTATADSRKIRADAEALHDLYNMFGRGRVNEWAFIDMYIRGKLPEFIKKVCEGKQ